MLSGCNAIHLTVLTVGALTTHAVTSPTLLCSTDDSIGVNYLTERPNNQHDEAMQLIRSHCANGYVETRRVNYPGSRALYATCLRADGSPATSEPCKYNANDDVGFGQTDVTMPDG